MRSQTNSRCRTLLLAYVIACDPGYTGIRRKEENGEKEREKAIDRVWPLSAKSLEASVLLHPSPSFNLSVSLSLFFLCIYCVFSNQEGW